MMLLTWANLSYYQELMSGMRQAIREGSFADFRARTRGDWVRGEKAPESP
jgi:queuine tRNA-ribosyltransferase